MTFPEVPSGLLEWLRKNYPNEVPRSDVGSFELGKRAGHQEIIEKLIHHHNRQLENANVSDSKNAKGGR